MLPIDAGMVSAGLPFASAIFFSLYASHILVGVWLRGVVGDEAKETMFSLWIRGKIEAMLTLDHVQKVIEKHNLTQEEVKRSVDKVVDWTREQLLVVTGIMAWKASLDGFYFAANGDEVIRALSLEGLLPYAVIGAIFFGILKALSHKAIKGSQALMKFFTDHGLPTVSSTEAASMIRLISLFTWHEHGQTSRNVPIAQALTFLLFLPLAVAATWPIHDWGILTWLQGFSLPYGDVGGESIVKLFALTLSGYLGYILGNNVTGFALKDFGRESAHRLEAIAEVTKRILVRWGLKKDTPTKDLVSENEMQYFVVPKSPPGLSSKFNHWTKKTRDWMLGCTKRDLRMAGGALTAGVLCAQSLVWVNQHLENERTDQYYQPVEEVPPTNVPFPIDIKALRMHSEELMNEELDPGDTKDFEQLTFMVDGALTLGEEATTHGLHLDSIILAQLQLMQAITDPGTPPPNWLKYGSCESVLMGTDLVGLEKTMEILLQPLPLAQR
jgi:hypothetical protein